MTFYIQRLFAVGVAVLLLVNASVTARADDAGHVAGEFASNTGNILFLSAGLLLPLVEDRHSGRSRTARVAESMATSTLISEALKRLVKEQRPDKGDHESFPSGHATAAFAVATVESATHPRQALLWYGGAALIGASRVALHRHYIHDVIAGSLLGYATSRIELAQGHGFLLHPVIEPETRSRGIALSFRF